MLLYFRVNVITILTIVFLSLFFDKSAFAERDSLTLMTFNIRYSSAKDGKNSWDERKGAVGRFLKSVQPDILFSQELMLDQTTYLRYALKDYDSVWRGRRANRFVDEACAIFYKTSRFEKVDGGTFWLSDTPQVPGSKSKAWMNLLPRIVTWAKLRDLQSQKVFLVMTTQFDFLPAFQTRAMQLVFDFIDAHPNDGVLFGGDFNAPKWSSAIQMASNRFTDSWQLVNPTADFGSFHGWYDSVKGPRVDFLFSDPENFMPIDSTMYTMHYEGKVLSDHFPQMARFLIVK